MTIWTNQKRIEYWPHSREYLLASLLVVLLDPKDHKALLIKSDPAYPNNTKRSERSQGSSTVWKRR